LVDVLAAAALAADRVGDLDFPAFLARDALALSEGLIWG
jgi:hypothetical protein